MRLLILEGRMRLLELRMSICQTCILCLKRGYLAPDEGNLVPYFRYVSAAIRHPVEIINVFLKCVHDKQPK